MDNIDKKIKDVLSKCLTEPEDFEKNIRCTLNKKGKNKSNNFTFFKNFIYANDKYSFSRVITTITLGICLMAGTAYDGVLGYNFIQNRYKIETKSEEIEDWSKYFNIKELENYGKIFYKVLNNYEEYTQFSNNWNNFEKYSQDDFQENNVLVIISQIGNGDMTIKSIEEQNNDPIIYLERNSLTDLDKDEKMIISPVPKGYSWDNIEFKLISGLEMEKYVKISDLPENYSEENAIQDNCFVIKNGNIISNDKKQFENFIENCEQNIEGQIRIVSYDDIDDSTEQRFKVADIIYKNGKYDLASYLVYKDEKINDYYSGEKIIKKENSKILPGRVIFNLISEKDKTSYSDSQGICSYYE